MPKVSVIVPVFNSEKYLSATLDSVLNQTFKDLEVVCINDGSTDKSGEILKYYQSLDKRVAVIYQENAGGSAARNAGLKYSKGDYVMFLDADDIYTKDIVEHSYSRAQATGADIVFYNFARFTGVPSKLAIINKTVPSRKLDVFTKETYKERFFNDFAIITWNKLIKKELISRHNLMFDTKLSHNHDVDFSIRLMLLAEKYSWLNEVGYFYRTNNSGITATKRSDPVNALKILANLGELINQKYIYLKRSFDNYVAEMIVGTLVKYGDDNTKVKEVFDYAYSTTIPEMQLANKNEGYFFTPLVDIFKIVEKGDFRIYDDYINSPKRRLRTKLRKFYDIAQRALSHIV